MSKNRNSHFNEMDSLKRHVGELVTGKYPRLKPQRAFKNRPNDFVKRIILTKMGQSDI
jgi:hypothetical protein